MPRSYRHIKEYEKDILELKAKGYTLREFGEKYGNERIQLKTKLTPQELRCQYVA